MYLGVSSLVVGHRPRSIKRGSWINKQAYIWLWKRINTKHGESIDNGAETKVSTVWLYLHSEERRARLTIKFHFHDVQYHGAVDFCMFFCCLWSNNTVLCKSSWCYAASNIAKSPTARPKSQQGCLRYRDFPIEIHFGMYIRISWVFPHVHRGYETGMTNEIRSSRQLWNLGTSLDKQGYRPYSKWVCGGIHGWQWRHSTYAATLEVHNCCISVTS